MTKPHLKLRHKPVETKSARLVDTEVGFIPKTYPQEYFQLGYDPVNINGMNGVVEACVKSYAETVAMCPFEHQRKTDSGAYEAIEGSAINRILHRPNSYQSGSDLILNTINQLLYEGNAFWYKDEMNLRGEYTQVHLLDSRTTRGAFMEDGGVAYGIRPQGWSGYSPVDAEEMTAVPAREIVHFKLFTDRDPLRGITPIKSIAYAVGANDSIMRRQGSYWSNAQMASGVLSTDASLTKTQMTEIREAFEERAHGLKSGKIPVLGSGMKFTPISLSNQDSQLIEMLNFTVEDIARAFRIPSPLINHLQDATLNNAEALINTWLSMGLGFMLNHIERTIAHSFDIPRSERIESSTTNLLKVDFKTRMDAYGIAVQRGVMTLNEARRQEGLGEVANGDEPVMQQQMVPLSYWQEEMDLRRREAEANIDQIENPPEPLQIEDQSEEIEERAMSADAIYGVLKGMQNAA